MANVKKPTELLKEEHQGVLARLDALQDAIGNLESREEVSSRLRELAFFFDVAFWVHFDKEEKALFPEFNRFMPAGSGPLAAMIDEHEVLRRTNVVMQEAVARYLGQDDSAETRLAISQSATHFIEFLRAHIFKEDSILFRMAEMHLDQRRNDRVVKRFSEIEEAAKAG